MKSLGLNKMQLLLPILFQKPKRSISVPNYQETKKKLYLYYRKWHSKECKFIKAKCNTYNKIKRILHDCKSTLKEEKNKQKKIIMYFDQNR